MAGETTYTRLRANPAAVLDQVVDRQEAVIVRRKGHGMLWFRRVSWKVSSKQPTSSDHLATPGAF